MWPSIRHRSLGFSSEAIHQWKSDLNRSFCSSIVNATNGNGKSGNVVELLNLEEVEKILRDVRADDVRVIPVKKQSEFANFVVVATGKSQWHVRNIAQALIYKVKQKQPGAKRMLLPSVEGQEGGNWIVIDSGSLIVHAFDEKARAYYNLEQLWTSKESSKEQSQSPDLDQAFVKVRRKNNSKKPAKG
ncbi:protein Iojap-related, mitochondrial [Cynara cardunculus var. scolymus]|uniref:protein Iojap-related, mitochondrial n=1 Tax=Cynara cardunculus var. scolymus TaxID=59895 RepID=UPI000D625EEA|nr:protein Iojap-related, mitochondrial [Cynara cardunculus var. scolymus]